MRRLFDTSALVPYYRQEALSDVAEAVLLSADEPWISDLVEVELASAFSRLVRMGELAESDARDALADFAEDLAIGGYERAHVAPEVFVGAKHWLARRETRLRALDALQLATANYLGAELVTADAALAESAAQLGIPCLLLGRDH